MKGNAQSVPKLTILNVYCNQHVLDNDALMASYLCKILVIQVNITYKTKEFIFKERKTTYQTLFKVKRKKQEIHYLARVAFRYKKDCDKKVVRALHLNQSKARELYLLIYISKSFHCMSTGYFA